MKRTVLTYGLRAGALLSLFMIATIPFIDQIGHSYLVGYAGMVLGFLMVFYGVRSYRDGAGGGSIGFLKAFGVGLGIMAVGSLCYVATWEVMFFFFYPDFMAKYAAHAIEQLRASGATAEQIAAKTAELEQYQRLYRNPLFNAAFTFLEPLPVGVIMVLVSAGILRRPPTAGSMRRGAVAA